MTPSAGTEEDCVLVVDDDTDIRESLVELLEERGCHAVGAANGREAIDLLANRTSERRTCLILLDLMMPIMDGPTFRQEQLKQTALADIPVAVISAFQDAAVREGKAMKAVDVLIKPFKISAIVRLAQQYCGCRESAP